MTTSEERISFKYAVFTLVTDDAGAVTVPVGVALWSTQSPWLRFQMIGENDRLQHVNHNEHLLFIRHVQDQVEHWAASENPPYAPKPMKPYEDGWWQHVHQLLIHRVRVSEPRAIDCSDPNEEFGPLFESIVGPFRTHRESRTRLAGQIQDCLGNVARCFKARQPLSGYGGRDVKVLRAHKGKFGFVVIEGVNLAAGQAEALSDALVSKLLRVKAANPSGCEFVVAYVSSPHGLNGEAVLVDWIKEKTGARVFDLQREREKLRQTATNLVWKADGQATLA